MKKEEEKENPNNMSVHSFKDHNFSIFPNYLSGDYEKVQVETFGREDSEIQVSSENNENTNPNDHSTIIYNKLNSFSQDQEEELVDTTGDFDSNSPRFSGTDRELIKKIIVQTEDETIEDFNAENFAIVSCKNITTIRIDNQKFSFLTNPTNDENFFYIEMNKSRKYSLIEESKYIEECMIYNKSEYKKLELLTNELNKILEPVTMEIKNEENRKIKKDLKSLMTVVVASFTFLLVFYFFVNFFSPFTKNILMVLFAFLALLLIANFYYKYKKDKGYLYSVYSLYLSSQRRVEKHLLKWNREYFHKIGIKATCPPGLQYIQLNLKPNIKLMIEDHQIYVLN